MLTDTKGKHVILWDDITEFRRRFACVGSAPIILPLVSSVRPRSLRKDEILTSIPEKKLEAISGQFVNIQNIKKKHLYMIK